MTRRKRTPWTTAVCIALSLSVLLAGGTAAGSGELAGDGRELAGDDRELAGDDEETPTADETPAAGDPLTVELDADSSSVATRLPPATNRTGRESNQTRQGERVQFAPEVFEDIAGQVATEDGEVTVEGTASGVDDVLVVMVDRRGRIASEIVSVDDDDGFEETVALVARDGTALSEGQIAAAVFSPSRDGVVGDGEIEGFTRADVAALDEYTIEKARQRIADRTVARTQAQVLELFYEESINDTGSDDLALADAFTYTDGRTSIETVVPSSSETETGIRPVSSGETMVVRGLTNRKPDDNTVTVEAVEGPTPEAFEFGATDEWGTDGVWSVELNTTGVEPGTYVVEADDGDDTARVEVRVLPRESGNATTTPAVTVGARSLPSENRSRSVGDCSAQASLLGC